jgi:predicted 2-oxoglutarate/Fe(II)-dependent dioxygenase YbiX
MNEFPPNYIKVFTPEECDEIIKYAENLNQWNLYHTETTRYQVCTIVDIEWMTDKFIKYVNNVLKINITHPKYIRCIKYETGDVFEKHIDHIPQHHFYGTFIYNINTVLNEDFEGGKFILNDVEYPTNKGYVYYYPSNLVHEVTEITKGTRYSILFGLFTDNIKRNNLI